MSTKTDTATGLAATAATGKTFDTVLADLAQPFDPEAVEFKAGATTQDKARALALAYVDSRVYQGRLDAVTPDWRNEYTREYAGERVIVTCALTVAGVTRQAIGESLQASASPPAAQPTENEARGAAARHAPDHAADKRAEAKKATPREPPKQTEENTRHLPSERNTTARNPGGRRRHTAGAQAQGRAGAQGVSPVRPHVPTAAKAGRSGRRSPPATLHAEAGPACASAVK